MRMLRDLGTVSYTQLHLRFPGVSACRLAEKSVRRDCDACGGECAAGLGRSGMGQIWIMAVSYTHLDVYKRQVP